MINFLLVLTQVAFAEAIISGFGLFYRTPYEDGLKQIKSDGFTITEKTIRRNTNTDRKIIEVGAFEYDGIPYLNGTFVFDRDNDENYNFSIAEGDVDLKALETNLDYAAKYKVFLYECKEKYIYLEGQNDDVALFGFKGDNGGYIILAFTDKLHIAYHPKGPN